MFENIKNFADLKKAYHKAARENHPDMGGDTETMKRINNDFDRAAKRIEREGESFGTEQAATENGKTTETAQSPAESRRERRKAGGDCPTDRHHTGAVGRARPHEKDYHWRHTLRNTRYIRHKIKFTNFDLIIYANIQNYVLRYKMYQILLTMI